MPFLAAPFGAFFLPRFCISDLSLLALSLEKVQSGPKTAGDSTMKMIFAILLMSVTSFAFAQEPDHHCDDPEMRALDPKCKKNDGKNNHCGAKPHWYDVDGGGYEDYLDRRCGHTIYCIKTFDEKTKKDVYHWSCSKSEEKNYCKGKAVSSCQGLKGDECTSSFIKGAPDIQCGLHSDGTCSNSGGSC